MYSTYNLVQCHKRDCIMCISRVSKKRDPYKKRWPKYPASFGGGRPPLSATFGQKATSCKERSHTLAYTIKAGRRCPNVQ